MFRLLLFTALGGAVGSLCRWGLHAATKHWFQGQYPIGTFLSNVLGCFVAGALAAWFSKNNAENEALRQLLLVGFCGGFTTFSSFSLENINLIQSGQTLQALLYTALSLLMGFGALALGMQTMK